MSDTAVDEEQAGEELKFYKTSDMGLATFLKMEGHTPQQVRFEHGTCMWLFERESGLGDAIDEFMDDTARVSPKSFNKEYGKTKSEFYRARDNA